MTQAIQAEFSTDERDLLLLLLPCKTTDEDGIRLSGTTRLHHMAVYTAVVVGKETGTALNAQFSP